MLWEFSYIPQCNLALHNQMEILMPKHPVSTILSLLALSAAPFVLSPVPRAFAADALSVADTDNDKTLSKDEYTAAAEKDFAAADADNDGKVEAKELKSKAGLALSKLIK